MNSGAMNNAMEGRFLEPVEGHVANMGDFNNPVKVEAQPEQPKVLADGHIAFMDAAREALLFNNANKDKKQLLN